MIDAITLQRVDQNQLDHICTKKNDEKHKNKICICDQTLLFSQCLFIVSVNQSSEWENYIHIRNETKQKVQQKQYMFHSIKRVVDTNILDGMISPLKRKKEDEEEKNKTSSDDDDSHFNYANSAFNYANLVFAHSTLWITYHSLMNSVIYNSSCSQLWIFDKTRFLKDISFSNDQIKISDDHMQIEEYEIMQVWEQLKSKKIEMTFIKTTYMFICLVTLVSQSKLEKERFDRDSFIKTLIHLKTSKQVYEIKKRFQMQLLEYTSIIKNEMMTNSI
jgi:hypothetical protein